MKKEIQAIKKILKQYEELVKTINLYKKYISHKEGGLEFGSDAMEDVETYMLASEIYEQGKVEELKELAETSKKESINLLEMHLSELEYELGSDFVNRCMGHIRAGDVEQVQIDLSKKEERIQTKTMRNSANSFSYYDQTVLINAERNKFVLTRLFGVKKEVYNPKKEICKPTVREDLDEITKTLAKLAEVTRISDLYKKYVSYLKDGRTISPLAIEDSEIYDIAKSVCKGGTETISKFEEYSEDRKKSYKESLKEQFDDLKSRLGSEVVDGYVKDMEEGRVKKVIAILSGMKNNVKVKTIKSYKDCQTVSERKLFYEAKKKSPIKTKLFGVKIEIIENEIQEKDLPRKERMSVGKIDLKPPVIGQQSQPNYRSAADRVVDS